MKDILEKAAGIRLLIFDVDGVLTDGSLFIGDDGQEYKAFNSRDGHGIKMLQKHGVIVAIITGRTSRVVEHRMENLGVSHVYQGKLEKLPAFEELIAELGIPAEQTAYVGDDVVDLPVMRRVGFAVTVADAVEDVKPFADLVTTRDGGRGAVREVCDFLLKKSGRWAAVANRYFED